MATNDRRPEPAMNELELIARDGSRYEFFQLVWLLSRLHSERAQPGGAGPIGEETVTFEGNLSLGFPKSEIECATVTAGRTALPPISIMTNFLSLYGVGSPLPTFYTEEMLENDAEERGSKQFLDIFNHRFVSFLFALWKKYRFFRQYGDTNGRSTEFYLNSILGLAFESQRNTCDLRGLKLLPFAGILPRNATTVVVMETVIADYFGKIPVKIEQFVARQITIDRSQWNALGKQNGVLGQSLFLGSRVWDAAGNFIVHLGPLTYEQYVEFLPNGKCYIELRRLIRYIVTGDFQYSFALKLSTNGLPPLNLSSSHRHGLGWTTWLGRPRSESIEIVQAS